MGYWWSGDPQEIYFFEITRSRELGTSLRAPLTAPGGSPMPEYALVPEVAQGNIVIHYDSIDERIVGVSQVSGPPFLEPVSWTARGSYARRAGVGPVWVAGMVVPLHHYTEMRHDVTFEELNNRRGEIFRIREQLQASHPEQPLHLPWIPYRNEMRTFPTYLAKFPAALLPALPEVAETVALVGTDPATTPELASPEVRHAAQAMASAAARPKTAAVDPEPGDRVAVEARALNVVLAHYSARGAVNDVGRTAGFDYSVVIDGQEWHVTVKGTTSSGEEIVLTPDEVAHARGHEHLDLCIVSNIRVERDEAGQSAGAGGILQIHHPWRIETDRLHALGYRYRLSS
jgi:hypothetical protein